jgi:hypothetical protein
LFVRRTETTATRFTTAPRDCADEIGDRSPSTTGPVRLQVPASASGDSEIESHVLTGRLMLLEPLHAETA